ncbi:MAG: DNA mismatch repair endonuclease MutL [Ruminococcaceae bacterium]|nr:DNA mismatch repair endonuclease MutL [Oscillospiraceae bacterium]
MSKVIVLDELTACQIAAGEVIERPASVVKELVENSIDAGGTSINVEIKRGGITYIRVTDNGSGIEADDAVICFDKHATSKIKCGDDLENVATLGFRGEALASIAAVADVELITRTQLDENATYVHIKGSDVQEIGSRGGAKGTTITVSDLFYNTPARFKFLKKDQTEASYCADVLQKMALAHPEISFRLVSSGQEIFRTPGDGSMKSAIYCIFGKVIADNILPVSYEMSGYKVEGFAGVKDAVSGNRARQIFFVNGRYIKSKVITTAVDEAYKTVVMKNKFPFIIINITVPVKMVDVNVHPTKIEVRFSNESDVFKAVYRGISNAIYYKDAPVPVPVSTPKPVPLSQPVKTAGPVTDNWKMLFPQTKANESYVREEAAPLPEFAPAPAPMSDPATISTPAPTKDPAPTKEYAPAPEASQPEASQPEAPQPETSQPEAPQPETSQPEAPALLIKDYNHFTDGIVIGQVFNTYIILQYEDKIILIDQHAAHERIKYEELKSSIGSSDIPTITMLVPQAINLTGAEYAAYCENPGFFTDMGFEIDEFGANTILVRSVPMTLEQADLESVITEALTVKNTVQDSDEKIFRMACKAAIKANKILSQEEIQALLRQLAKLDSPNTCPHGRPISVEITQHELERKFKRCL